MDGKEAWCILMALHTCSELSFATGLSKSARKKKSFKSYKRYSLKKGYRRFNEKCLRSLAGYRLQDSPCVKMWENTNKINRRAFM